MESEDSCSRVQKFIAHINCHAQDRVLHGEMWFQGFSRCQCVIPDVREYSPINNLRAQAFIFCTRSVWTAYFKLPDPDSYWIVIYKGVDWLTKESISLSWKTRCGPLCINAAVVERQSVLESPPKQGSPLLHRLKNRNCARWASQNFESSTST